ncbi:MAG: DUF4785 family protein [Dokdonella sp.]|nr:DUF4785 family protein [Dokdonella sp.]
MNFSNLRPLPLVAALALASGLAASAHAAPALRLLAASSQDLIATELVTPVAKRQAADALERAPLAVSWPLDASAALDAQPQAYVAQSREYWVDASASELQAGLRLKLSSPGALVRISPHAGKAAVSASDVQLTVDGRRLDNSKSMSAVADADALHAAGMDVPQGSIIMKLDSKAVGDVRLAMPAAQGAHLVHVFEPASAVALSLAATRDSIAGGDTIAFRAQLEGATLDRIGGLVSAPDGSSQNVDFVRQGDGSYLGQVRPDLAHAGGPGLWEMHAFGVTAGKDAIPRDAKTAFAVSVPVARLDGHVSQSASLTKDGSIAVRIGVQASVASRYAVSGVLHGTGDDGQLHPVAMGQSAAWLQPGRGTLELRYDAASLSLHAPWEVRDLRLVNQADFSLQERRARALYLP